MTDAKSESIRVVVRCRPLNSTETKNGNYRIVEMDSRVGSVSVSDPSDQKQPPKTFTYDAVYDWNSTQDEVFRETAKPIINSVLEGYNGTIFAYGQTGTGKTHTMEGAYQPAELRGIIPRSFAYIFDSITNSAGTQFLVRVTFLEIYNDEIRDLLQDTDQRLDLKENQNGVYVKDLSTHIVQSEEDTMQLLELGKSHRKKGATLMNPNSSRSHCIFTLTIESSDTREDGTQHIRAGKLNMVDLAGSERQDKTGAQGVRLKEAAKINLSLTALGNVISALTSRQSKHVPYRDSRLTRLLQDSLGGNTKTVMVANIGPADYNFEETVSSLRFASRAKQIQNKPIVNEDPKDTLLRQYQLEIEELKAQLASIPDGTTASLDLTRPAFQTGATPGGTTPGKAPAALAPIAPQKVLVERVVEKVITKKGFDEAKVRELEESSNKARKALEEKMQAERQSLLEQTTQAEQTTNQMAKELRKKENRIEKQKREREALLKKLEEMEQKVLIGNQIEDQARKHEHMLEQKREELRRAEQERLRIQQALREREEIQSELASKSENLDQMIMERTNKLRKLWDQYKQLEQDINDQQAEFQREREYMLENCRELHRGNQLRQLIIELFVSKEEREKVERRAMWDDETGEWSLAPIDFSNYLYRKHPGSARDGLRRPISQYARVAAVANPHNPRYRHHNTIQLDLDPSERTTQDWDMPDHTDNYDEHEESMGHSRGRRY
eukprot:TRINITY_DN5959_c0_g1_i6.p1 TRINITY_DN5959_c0_g1~~TRINITY_DN5959_c0_g1_i6.p1  ORF type:complete len:726 (-),score=130.19 TRINITY_DN5959_c0_g1_i6:93-2270(-)